MGEGQKRKLSNFSNKNKNSMNDVEPQDLTAPVELSKGWFEFKFYQHHQSLPKKSIN